VTWTPRTQVVRTTPAGRRPAYGVTGCLWVEAARVDDEGVGGEGARVGVAADSDPARAATHAAADPVPPAAYSNHKYFSSTLVVGGVASDCGELVPDAVCATLLLKMPTATSFCAPR
jgi:hypothetical protein